MQRLNRIFTHARQLSLRGDLGQFARLDETTLDDMEMSGGAGKALKDAGITGPGAVYLGQVFHRVHALRTAIALLGQFNTGQYQKDIQTMTNAEAGHVSDVNDMAKSWENFRRQAQLKEAGIALSRLGLQVSQIFEPVFNLGARGLTGLSSQAGQHRDIARGVTFGATGLAALYGLSKLRGGMGIGRLLSRGSGVATGAQVAQNLLTGQVPKGTVSDPLFVIVLRQLGGARPTVQYPGPIGPERGPGASRGPGLLRFAPLGGPAAAAAAALLATPGAQAGTHGRSQNWLRQHYPSLFAAGVERINPVGGFVFRQGVSQSQREMLSRLHREHSTGELNRILRDSGTPKIRTGHYSIGQEIGGAVQARLSGVVDLDINYNQPDGTKARKKVHVRVDTWQGGNTPQHRGRNRASRR